jgi:hypothetical protein
MYYSLESSLRRSRFSFGVVNFFFHFRVKKEPDVIDKTPPVIDETSDHQTILNILLHKPEELELKPSGIRENKMFTLDMRKISIVSAGADDNGAYFSKGSAKKHYTYTEHGSQTAHKNEDGTWYVNEKVSKEYRRRVVPESQVYELTRLYRTSKNNPDFSRLTATVRACNEKEMKPYYLVMYRWADGKQKEFVLSRHGNATKPTTSAYYRQDPGVFTDIEDMISEGMSTERIYSTMANRNVKTVSQTVSRPKIIDNRKLALKSSFEIEQERHSEAEILVSSLRTVPLINSVTFSKEQYISVNSLPNMLNDVYRFCVLGNSILRIDTTFELVDSLWLTDTTFTNEALIDLNGKHPEFPGPSFWHFKKTRESYRRFAGELAIAKPELLGIKKIGHDLDQAIAKGVTDIFREAEQLYCTQLCRNLMLISYNHSDATNDQNSASCPTFTVPRMTYFCKVV